MMLDVFCFEFFQRSIKDSTYWLAVYDLAVARTDLLAFEFSKDIYSFNPRPFRKFIKLRVALFVRVFQAEVTFI